MKPTRVCCGNCPKGQVRLAIVVVCAFLLIATAAGTSLWYSRTASRSGSEEILPAATALSDSTRAVLSGLGSPVEIRFYTLLDPAGTSESLRSFARRVDQLLSAYDREGRGLVKVIRMDSASATAADAASADGVRPFNLDKGDACFLGIAVSCDERRETIPQLAEEWEQALESDLSRMIARVGQKAVRSASLADAARVETTDAEQLIRSNPKLGSLSVEEGTQVLRDAALADFKTAVSESQARVQAAEQRLMQAQSAGSESELQAAAKELQQIRADQTRKTQEIASRLQVQIAMLERIKRNAP